MKKQRAIIVAILSLGIGTAWVNLPRAGAQADSGPAAIAKSVGTVKTISGNAMTLVSASGPAVAVTVEPAARILRMAAGDKDLKNASAIQLTDVQVGDTVRVRGHATAGGIDALEVLVITRASVDAARDQVRQDWQKRGVGGLVDSVDAAGGNVNLSIPGLAGKKTVVVRTTKSTVVRRYAPDSAKPEDAKLGMLQDIQIGDQMRARGNRSADGSELTAEEIYTGVFPQFAAVIKSIDASAGTLSVQDLGSKKTVQVKITADSQLHKIPAEMAQGFAMRLKSMLPPGTPGAAPGQAAGLTPAAGNAQPGASAGGTGPDGGAGAGMRRNGGPPDLSRMLSRLPSSTLADLALKKGDAVYVLTTEGTASNARTAIFLLSGVEPILQAVPNAGQAMMLTPWALGGAPGGGDAQ